MVVAGQDGHEGVVIELFDTQKTVQDRRRGALFAGCTMR